MIFKVNDYLECAEKSDSLLFVSFEWALNEFLNLSENKLWGEEYTRRWSYIVIANKRNILLSSID